jgi:hypothetical protein
VKGFIVSGGRGRSGSAAAEVHVDVQAQGVDAGNGGGNRRSVHMAHFLLSKSPSIFLSVYPIPSNGTS